MDSEYSDEEIVENPTFKAAYNLEPLHHNQRLRWDHKVRLIGEKVFDPQVHLCEKCQYPILVYGRMLPCKHVFCLDCAKKYEKVCPRCQSRVQRIEQSALGTVFICTHGAPKHSVNGCRRTYLSFRDLQAHIAHRHSVKQSSSSSSSAVLEENKSSTSSSHVHSHQQQQQQQQHISSSNVYERHDVGRERETRGESLRSVGTDRDRGGSGGDLPIYRPLEGPPPPLSASHVPPPMGGSHLQHPPPSASALRHPPPALHLQHPAATMRMTIPTMQQQQPPPAVPSNMESYQTAPIQSMGVGGGPTNSTGNVVRTNQNLITVPIQDESPDSYHTSRRQQDISSYQTASPHSVPPSHPTSAPPPASYTTAPPPHMGMPPPRPPNQPFNPGNMAGVGRVPFNTATMAQAVVHLASMTHALTQQQRAAAAAAAAGLQQHLAGNPPPQRMNLPPPGTPMSGSTAPPSRYPHSNQPNFSNSGSPMHWSNTPPRQAQPQLRHQPPMGQRPPNDSGGYTQYY